MNDRSRFVTRWAQLNNNFDDPTQTGAYCEITSYHSDDDMFEVKLSSTQKYVHARPSDLSSFYDDDFVTRFPRAVVVPSNQVNGRIPAGAIVDCSATESHHLVAPITNSCRLIGNATTISSNIYVELEANETDIVEFEGICFEPYNGHKQRVDCVRGLIVFRSCTFQFNQIGVEIGFGDNAQVGVVFENCIFHDHKDCGVKMNSGRATFVNCKFMSTGLGVTTTKKTFAGVIACHFKDCVIGVLLPNGGESEICYSTFENVSDFGVLASNGSEADISSCVFKECNEGVVIEGGDGTLVNIRNCIMEAFRIGVRIGNGRVQVTLQDISIKASIFGVYAAIDSKGTVSITRVDCADLCWDIVSLSGKRCKLTVDGVENRREQIDRLRSFQDVMKSTDIKYGYPVSADGKRVLSEAGLTTVQCANCKAGQTSDQRYKKCARCREARYCSRACQVEHYNAHHTECIVTFMQSRIMCARGYIKCNECGDVEVQSANKPHCACSRCMSVFYCCRQCQVSNWKEHRKQCKPYKDTKYNTS